MNQAERMKSASNHWEADPWDATDEVADAQLAGFNARGAKPIVWARIRDAGGPVFGIETLRLISADAEFYSTHDGEELLLMRLLWHGYPDPPEWRLASRAIGVAGAQWMSWGYFAAPPDAWKMPGDSG